MALPDECHRNSLGFAPWYAGLKIGFLGLGVRSLYGTAVQLSSAWNRTSNPEEMCTARGHESVLSGSTIPSRGRRAREAMPVLACRCGRSAIAVPVVCFKGASISVSLREGGEDS